jgi:hypothetical protein
VRTPDIYFATMLTEDLVVEVCNWLIRSTELSRKTSMLAVVLGVRRSGRSRGGSPRCGAIRRSGAEDSERAIWDEQGHATGSHSERKSRTGGRPRSARLQTTQPCHLVVRVARSLELMGCSRCW